jgi:hypothetical protein
VCVVRCRQGAGRRAAFSEASAPAGVLCAGWCAGGEGVWCSGTSMLLAQVECWCPSLKERLIALTMGGCVLQDDAEGAGAEAGCATASLGAETCAVRAAGRCCGMLGRRLEVLADCCGHWVMSMLRAGGVASTGVTPQPAAAST